MSGHVFNIPCVGGGSYAELNQSPRRSGIARTDAGSVINVRRYAYFN